MGILEGSSFTRDFERWRALERGHLSLWELYEENLEGGLHYWGPQRNC